MKQALALQVELEQTRQEMAKWGMSPHHQNKSDKLSAHAKEEEDDAFQDGSFDHYVNYRSMAEFESH